MNNYLKWRCKTSWHNKYHKYIDEWIKNVTEEQLSYFVIEREHLIKSGVYG